MFLINILIDYIRRHLYIIKNIENKTKFILYFVTNSYFLFIITDLILYKIFLRQRFQKDKT